MLTLARLIDTHGADVHEHLDRDELVPVLTGLQFQGDVAVIPTSEADPRSTASTVPAAGIPVVRGENGGNTHLLLATGPCTWAPAGPVDRSGTGLDLGVLGVPDGATAYLAHPEHGYLGVGPGRYVVRRQREQAEQVRLVAD